MIHFIQSNNSHSFIGWTTAHNFCGAQSRWNRLEICAPLSTHRLWNCWLICQALILANSASKQHNFSHKAIELSTHGLIFLGTPHQGAEHVELALLILKIQSIYSETNDTIVQDLQLHSKTLQQQLDQYASISHKYETKFCYEMYETKLFGGKSMKVCHSLYMILSMFPDEMI